MVSYMWGKDVADALRIFPLRMPVEFKPIDKPKSPR